MRPVSPLAIVDCYVNRLRDRLVPLRKTEVDGIKFYYSRGNEPQDPGKMGQTREMYSRLDSVFGEMALDIGAHIGSYALRMSRRFRQVVAFEPNPFNRYILGLNIQLNKIANVRVEDAALSNIDEVRPFYFHRAAGGSGSLDPLHYGFKYDRTVQVKVKKLDSFEFPTVDVIKIDAERSEFPILLGAARTIERCRPILAIEVHQAKSSSDAASCNCETCQYLRLQSYDLSLLGTNSIPPAHWVLASPKMLGKTLSC